MYVCLYDVQYLCLYWDIGMEKGEGYNCLFVTSSFCFAICVFVMFRIGVNVDETLVWGRGWV